QLDVGVAWHRAVAVAQDHERVDRVAGIEPAPRTHPGELRAAVDEDVDEEADVDGRWRELTASRTEDGRFPGAVPGAVERKPEAQENPAATERRLGAGCSRRDDRSGRRLELDVERLVRIVPAEDDRDPILAADLERERPRALRRGENLLRVEQRARLED